MCFVLCVFFQTFHPLLLQHRTYSSGTGQSTNTTTSTEEIPVSPPFVSSAMICKTWEDQFYGRGNWASDDTKKIRWSKPRCYMNYGYCDSIYSLSFCGLSPCVYFRFFKQRSKNWCFFILKLVSFLLAGPAQGGERASLASRKIGIDRTWLKKNKNIIKPAV